MKIEVPEGKTGKKLFKWLVQNKSIIIAQKKFSNKEADAISFETTLVYKSGQTAKADTSIAEPESGKIQAQLAINTTNFLDSHMDVHIPGLWTKTIAESTGMIYLLQEHKMEFKKIITDQLTPSAKNMLWSALGAPFEGKTQVLMFDCIIDKKRNDYMFDQYCKGYVKNHSVGMRYVKIYMCINDEDYSSEFDNWNKYYPEVANKDVADHYGYFFAVTEAKIIEGSAVPRGSNWVTPTLNIQEAKSQPPQGTVKSDIEPPVSTQIVKQDNKVLLTALKNLQNKLN